MKREIEDEEVEEPRVCGFALVLGDLAIVTRICLRVFESASSQGVGYSMKDLVWWACLYFS